MPSYSGFKFTSRLPHDIAVDILTRLLEDSPVCALSLLCPDWALCRRTRPGLEEVLRCTRVDTYTLPPAPALSLAPGPRPRETPIGGGGGGDANGQQQQQRGTVETKFGHCCARRVCDDHGDRVYDGNGGGGGGVGVGGRTLGTTGESGPDGAKMEWERAHPRTDWGDCIPLPRMRDPRGGLGYLPPRFLCDLVPAWAGRSAVVMSQRFEPLGPLWREIPREAAERMLILREPEAVRLLPFEDDFCGTGPGGTGRMVYGVDGQEKETVPRMGAGEREEEDAPEYLYQRIRHLVVNTAPALAELEVFDLGMLPSIWGSEVSRNLVHLEARLVYERKANLLLRWDALERLQTLCLDLRGYSMPLREYLTDEDVARLARSLSGKGLRLLVVAGLRSWGSLYPGPDALDIEEVEGATWDPVRQVWVDEVKGTITWWKMFMDAVRPGGRLVFVDKDADRTADQELLQPSLHHRMLLES